MSAQALVLRHTGLELPVCFATVDALPAEEFLNTDEKELSTKFSFAAKRDSFLLGRLAAKRALGALLNEPDLRQIVIRSGIYGQPLVDHPRAAAVQVTVTHSHGLAVALAFPAACPMGIDLETVSAVSAPTILGEIGASPAELAWLVAPGVDAATACGVLWTAREALGKSMQVGINSPLGILALCDIQNAGAGSWTGSYANFPQCRCLAQAQGGRVLTLALPKDAQLSAGLRLP